MQVNTHRDQCTLVGSIYRDAHVLELDNGACTSTVQYSTVQYNTVQYSTVQHSTSINIVRMRSNYGKGSLQYSTVQYSTVRYRSINMQVSTHRDQCTLVGSM